MDDTRRRARALRPGPFRLLHLLPRRQPHVRHHRRRRHHLHLQRRLPAHRRVLPRKTVTHEYDEWGNEDTRITTQGGTTTETYGYNYLNVLSTYTNSTSGANFQYDHWPTGERYAKTNLAGSTTKELYVPRFRDVATDYTQVGTGSITLLNSYVQGLGIDSKSTRIPATGGTSA